MVLLGIILSVILLIICVGIVIKQGADCVLQPTLLNTAFCGVFIMFAILVLYDTANHSELTSNSEKVLSVQDIKCEETVIYVDDDGEYFYLVSNNWDIYHPKEKIYIPVEKIEEYLEHYNAIQKIDLFEKGEK